MNQFHNMQTFPEKDKTPNGKEARFSIDVVLYSSPDINCIGYYNYSDKEWITTNGYPYKMYCWSYIPDPTEFIASNNLEPVIIQK